MLKYVSTEMIKLKGQRYQPETKIILNFTLGLFIGVLYKNTKHPLVSEIFACHLLVTVKFYINAYICSSRTTVRTAHLITIKVLNGDASDYIQSYFP